MTNSLGVHNIDRLVMKAHVAAEAFNGAPEQRRDIAIAILDLVFRACRANDMDAVCSWIHNNQHDVLALPFWYAGLIDLVWFAFSEAAEIRLDLHSYLLGVADSVRAFAQEPPEIGTRLLLFQVRTTCEILDPRL